MFTTLNQIRSKLPCNSGWRQLLSYLNKTIADDVPLSIITILDSNGLDDAIWCLRAVESHDKEIRLYSVWCARQVQHLMTDQRSIDAIDASERFANGEATQEELDAACDAAWNAAADAARDSARDSARSASDAARAAWFASALVVRGVVWDAAGAARDAAAYAGMRIIQEARLREICQ